MHDLVATDGLKIKVDVLVLFDSWSKVISDPHALCLRLIQATYDVCKDRCEKSQKPEVEVSIVLADDKFITDLNLKYRNINKPTNVLSFPNEDISSNCLRNHCEITLLGDIVVSYETVLKESNSFSKPIINYFAHMIIHGMLHLFGFDHDTVSKAREMESFEKQALDSVNFKNYF